MIGKVLQTLGRKNEALVHLSTALDLDPKDSALVKAVLEKMDDQSQNWEQQVGSPTRRTRRNIERHQEDEDEVL